MADAMPRPGRKCAKGHSMDPSWETCPYCEAEQRSKQKTSGFEAMDSSERQRTRVGAVRAQPLGRKPSNESNGGADRSRGPRWGR